jgi:hypothetical protein
MAAATAVRTLHWTTSRMRPMKRSGALNTSQKINNESLT